MLFNDGVRVAKPKATFTFDKKKKKGIISYV
jgi:hypothetical protein